MADNDWTDDLKQEVVDAYLAKDPTAENTMEKVKEVAAEFDKTPNGVRVVLSRAGAYVKKVSPTTTESTSTSTSTGVKRVNKTEAINELKKKIEEKGHNVDDDICDRFTGKAAVYITGILGPAS